MKIIRLITTIFILVLTVNLVYGQEKPQESTQQNGVTKANHNTTRTNKTTIAAPDKETGGDVSTGTGSSGSGLKATDYNSSRSNRTTNSMRNNSDSSLSKKGYDSYKASSVHVRKRPGGTKDHISSRSNKTSSSIDQSGGNEDGDLNKSDVDKKTNKSEAARSKKK